jgi:putative tryptophan/tyrosine transport system substrate-binding protein
MRIGRTNRREFIVGLGGATAWPVVARAQQTRRIGVLMSSAADDPQGQAHVKAFQQGLQQLGWTDGANVRIDVRSSAGDPNSAFKHAAEMVALSPDVLVAFASLSVEALQRATHSVPIVFASIVDPVGAGFVKNLARPGGNITGFTPFEYSLSGKWLELLKEIAPKVTRVAVLRDPRLAAGIGQYAVIQAMAAGVELSAIDMLEAGEIERALAAFADEPNGGLIVTADVTAVMLRNRIISLATRYRLPNVYSYRYYPESGGLASYGPDPFDSFRRAAGYVDRILKGEKPANLPVQASTKYELVINLKTAKALGLNITPTLLARADEVIE